MLPPQGNNHIIQNRVYRAPDPMDRARLRPIAIVYINDGKMHLNVANTTEFKP